MVGRQAHVDHIDGDSSNNDTSNLQTLCQQGHSRKTFAEQRGVKWDGRCEREANLNANLNGGRVESPEGRLP